MKDSSIKNTVFIAFFFTCYLVLYWRRALVFGMIPFDGDTLRLVYPSWVVGKTLFKDGFFFLWDSYRNMGMPFLASPPNQALYPLRFLSFFIDFVDYERIFIVFHVLIISGFSFGLFYKRHQEIFPALGAAIAMGFNGFVLARVTVNIDFAAMAWVPACLFFLELKRPVWLGTAIALLWLAGLPTFFIISSIILVLFSFARKDVSKSLVCLFKGFSIAAGLCAIQYLPFLEMLRESVRPIILSPEIAMQYSLKPLELARSLLIPAPFINQLKPISDSDPAVTGFYMGPFLLFLFLMGIFRGNKYQRFIGLFSLIGFLLSIGGYIPFYQFIPGITIFRFPGQWLLMGTFCFVFVAAEGIGKIKGRKVQFLLVFLIALDLLLYAWPAHSSWGDKKFVIDNPKEFQAGENLTRDHRVFHTEKIMGQIHKWGIYSAADWLVLMRMAAPSIGAGFLWHEARSRHQLEGRRHYAFIRRLNNSPFESELFDLSGVKRIFSLKINGPQTEIPKWDDIVVYDNPNPKPRVFMTNGQVIKILKDGPGKMSVFSRGEGLLVFSEVFYPGWRVFIDGKKVELKIFENIFLSVWVPAGQHHVHFLYRPHSFVIGAFISIFTVLFLLILSWLKTFR